MIKGLSAPIALIGIAEKGYASLELTVTDPGGHASIPPANTAVGILSRAISRIESAPLPPRFRGATRQLFQFIGPELPWVTKALLANLWLFSPIVERELTGIPLTNAMIRTTIAATLIQGGVRENVLPTRARAVLNIRLLPGDTLAEVVDHVRRTINDSRVAITPGELALNPSSVSDVDSANFDLLQRTIRRIDPQTIVAPALLVAATDSRHYATLSNDIFRFRPLTLRAEDLRRFHGINERISVKDYEQCVRFYVELIRNSNE
jgi:carboxypeptidase PM20D1